MKKKIVFLTGSGISAESGIPTFRMAADALWENHNVNDVCTHEAWLKDPFFVNKFYNELRVKYKDVKPNEGHSLIASLEDEYDVTVVTQNVDNLHEQAGSSNVLHLHGELMKCCSSENPEDEKSWVILPKNGFGKTGLEIPNTEFAEDGSLLRPYIVFFGEPVPNLEKAANIISQADILVVIGTSLNVYPAAGLLQFFDIMKPLYIIDPSVDVMDKILIKNLPITHIKKGASEGMKELIQLL